MQKTLRLLRKALNPNIMAFGVELSLQLRLDFTKALPWPQATESDQGNLCLS